MRAHPLPAGVQGRASFKEGNTHREWLERYWGLPTDPYALWIGMNPSTAGADNDDPTIGRETSFTRALGLTRFVKVNVLDYISTDPAGLLTTDLPPCSPTNLQLILDKAMTARLVILAYGVVPKPLQGYADRAVQELRKAGYPLHCLGTTAMGHPRHPLYLKGDTPLVPYTAQTYR